MGLEWQMTEEALDDDDTVSLRLAAGWEPFAVFGERVYLKKQFFNEASETRSSANAGNENLEDQHD